MDDYPDVVSYVNFHGGFVESGRSHEYVFSVVSKRERLVRCRDEYVFSVEAKHERPVQCRDYTACLGTNMFKNPALIELKY